MRRKQIQMPRVELRASVSDAVSIDDRTAEATFYTGAEVVRHPLFDDPYLLSFSMDPAAVRLDRLNAGAPILDSHNHYQLDAVLGVVESAWLDNGEGRAQLRFSKRPEVDGVWQDVQDKVLRNLSMGVTIHELTELGTDEDTGYARVQATDWEPSEISLLGVGADAGAQILAAADSGQHPCRLSLMEEHPMRFKKCPSCKEKLAADVEKACPGCDVNLDEAEDARAERERVGGIHQIAAHFGLDDIWTQRHITSGTQHTEALADATREKAKRHPVGPNDIGFGTDHDSPGARVEMMAEGVVARARRQEPSEAGRRYFGATLVELAHEVLSWAGKHRGLDVRHHAGRILELALHTTSDYAGVLANVLNKIVQPEYQLAAPTYRAICGRRSFNDFRPHSFVRLGDFPDLMEVNEHGEIHHGTISENAESVTAANYARIYGIDRHVLVNDDVGAFEDLARKAAVRVANFENGLFYALLTSGSGLGPTLSDSKTVFHGDHGNVGTGVIDVDNVGAGVALMMKQTGLDGVKLNVEPSVLLVSPDNLATARQFVSQNLRPAQPSEVQPFTNLVALADANLATAAPWYLFAAPGSAPAFVYGYVGGMEGPRVDTRAGWEVEGVEMRVSLDFGVGATDYRGAFRSTGA